LETFLETRGLDEAAVAARFEAFPRRFGFPITSRPARSFAFASARVEASFVYALRHRAVHTAREGAAVRSELFLSRAEAVEAVGLRE